MHHRSHDWGLHPEGWSASGASTSGDMHPEERGSASRGKEGLPTGEGTLPTGGGGVGQTPQNWKSGRYASYWNASLFYKFIRLTVLKIFSKAANTTVQFVVITLILEITSIFAYQKCSV